jgi:hypothetical protein
VRGSLARPAEAVGPMWPVHCSSFIHLSIFELNFSIIPLGF